MNDIDYVVPMVFPEDAEWLREYHTHKGAGAEHHVRYRSWGTEELLLRCVKRNMPWLRRIHVLLACESQVQGWMRDFPDLHVVYHRDFMPPEYLPCFSSPCMEMFLKDIPGLSERFVYGNDDMFPLSPLTEEDFFRDGVPVQAFTERTVPARPNLFQRKCLYQQDMVGRPFGFRGGVWLDSRHTLAPVLKASCEEVMRRHGAEIMRHLSPLKRTDRSCSHYAYTLYQHFAGLEDTRVPREQYVGADAPVERVTAVLRDPQAGIVCLNDNERTVDWQWRAALVRKELAARLGTQTVTP